MQKVKSADGTSIAFERLGSGPPVILVGGAFCDRRARAAGLPLARAMAEAMTVYCVDRRGRGDSTDTSPYAVAREVEDIAALLQVAGGRAHAYGHSAGATLLLEAALADLPISKLALYEPPLVLAGQREQVPPDLAEQAELFLTRAIGMPFPYVQQMKAGPVWASLEALAHTLSYDATITVEPLSVLARAPQIRKPVLLLDGEKSQPWMRGAVAKLAQAIAGAQYVSLPEQTHDVAPEQLGPRLLEFFLA
jgi:pimeloyl-ACP methyl ester carboxylesterase